MTVDSKVEKLIKKNILIVDDHPFIIDGYKKRHYSLQTRHL